MSTSIVDAGGIWGVLKNIVREHGPWAFFAVILLLLIVVFQLQPAAAERVKSAEERSELLKVVTNSLERNSTAMEKMAFAVESLERTLSNLEALEESAAKNLSEFTQGTNRIHELQLNNHTKIIDNQTEIINNQSKIIDCVKKED